MNGLFKKAMLLVAGALTLLGISVTNVTATESDIIGKTPLYLEHGKYSGSGIDMINWHSSHASHGSHGSHVSHASHASGW